MGNFSDAIAAADLILLSTFSKTDASDGSSILTLYPVGGAGAGVKVSAIEKNITLEDDYVPGSEQGTASLKLFVRADAMSEMKKGMRAEYGGVDYDVIDVSVDREGGATLTMKKRSAR